MEETLKKIIKKQKKISRRLSLFTLATVIYAVTISSTVCEIKQELEKLKKSGGE